MSSSLGRALRILIELGDSPASMDELTGRLEVHKTTVLRLLRTLAEEHFVHRDGQHRYHLGARQVELSSRGLDQREVCSIAAPHLLGFNRAHGHTTHLSERIGSGIVYIDKLESHDHVRMASRVGLRRPVHSTAVGKVMLTDLGPAERGRVLDGADLGARTPNTITDRAAYRTELDRVRDQGWALGAGPRGERALDQLYRGVGPRTGRNRGGGGVGIGAEHRRDLRPADRAGPVTTGRDRSDLPRPRLATAAQGHVGRGYIQ